MSETARLVTVVETKGVKKATDELNRFGGAAGRAEKDSVSLAGSMKRAAPIAKNAALVMAGVVTSLSAMAARAAEAEKEWRNLAAVANSTTSEFKATAFAADQFNISAEKLSDISKDVNEKLGEFVATGGGGFKDFFENVAPKVGIAADELQNLSGPQVLQRVKDAMDDANVSMEEQSFYLESIASDTTLLIPLLSDHGAKLNSLSSEYSSLNDQLRLSSEQSDSLKELSTSFDLLSSTGGNALTLLTGIFAEELSDHMKDWAGAINIATINVTEFFDSFRDAENQQLLSNVNKSISASIVKMENYQKLADEAYRSPYESAQDFRDRVQGYKNTSEEIRAQIDILRERRQEIMRQPDAVEPKAAPAKKTRAINLTPAVGVSSANDSDYNPNADRSAEIAQWQSGQDELFKRQQESKEREKALMDKFREDELKSEQDYIAAQAALKSEAATSEEKGLGILYGTLQTLSRTGNKELFRINQVASTANAVANIAEGVSEALSLGPILGPAAAAGIAASGAVQIAAIHDAGNFESGGIVGGSSFSGDNMTANVNSGEMILNRQQQKNLFDQANGKAGGSANIVINNTVSNDTSVTATQDDDGRIAILVERQLVSQVSQPNSNFNKALNRSRRAPRIL